MADFREISQEYAKEAIRTCLALNAGAAGTLLTQAADLRSAGLADEVMWATILWTSGAAAATIVWFLAFVSTRYVDKSLDERKPGHMAIANLFMASGFGVALISLILFVVGCYMLANGLGAL